MNETVQYIGLDISTSIIGVCFLNNNNNLIDLQNINLKKIKCIFQKSNIVKEKFKEYTKKYNISENVTISIEESFQSFSKGFSSAKTLSQLNRFNGIVSYLSSEVFSTVPVYINVNSARKSLQIKLNKDKNKSTKEQIFEWVREREDFDWPIKTLKNGPNKGLVKYDESCYDMSDAYIICKAYIIHERDNTTKNKLS